LTNASATQLPRTSLSEPASPRLTNKCPTNPAFIMEYREALQAFLCKHRNDADPDLVEDYEHELEKLGQTQN